jgi:hypothetical protein
MKRLGRYIWVAFVLAIIVLLVLFNLDEVRDLLSQLLDSFARLPLISKILIGFAIWLVSVIVPGFFFGTCLGPRRATKTKLAD